MTSIFMKAGGHALPVNRVQVDRSGRWLALAWRDITRTPVLSLGYGAVFALIGYLIAWGFTAMGVTYLTVPAAIGFLFVGPWLAIGLYELSRRHETGEPIRADTLFDGFRRNGNQILFLAVALLLVFAFWLNVAMVIFGAILAGQGGFALGNLGALVSSPAGLTFLGVGGVVGALFAIFVFMTTVVAVPMMLDRRVDIASAVITSWNAVIENPKVMAGWAVTLALIAVAGLALAFVGLIVAFPLLGHASWHAYRDLVKQG